MENARIRRSRKSFTYFDDDDDDEKKEINCDLVIHFLSLESQFVCALSYRPALGKFMFIGKRVDEEEMSNDNLFRHTMKMPFQQSPVE